MEYILSRYSFYTVAISLSLVIILLVTNVFVRFTYTIIPKEKPTIIIDAGHGGEDGGAKGINGDMEKTINLKISEKLRDFLNLNSFEVVMTRNGDYDLGDGTLTSVAERKRSDIKARITEANKHSGALVISIHQNHFAEEKYSGTQVFYGIAEGSAELAESIQQEVVDELQPENKRKIKGNERNIYLLKKCINPCVIVECGFISNSEECEKLCDNDYQTQIACTIATGIMKFCD